MKHFSTTSCTCLALYTSSLQPFNSNTRFEILFFVVILFFPKWKVQQTTKLHMFMCTLNEKEKWWGCVWVIFCELSFFSFSFVFIFIILQIHCKILLKTYYQLSNFFFSRNSIFLCCWDKFRSQNSEAEHLSLFWTTRKLLSSFVGMFFFCFFFFFSFVDNCCNFYKKHYLNYTLHRINIKSKI